MEMDSLIIANMTEMHEISAQFPPAMTPLKRASMMQGMKNNKQLQNLLREEMKEEQNMEEKGCTANVILFVPADGPNPAVIYCANAGDSRSVMAN